MEFDRGFEHLTAEVRDRLRPPRDGRDEWLRGRFYALPFPQRPFRFHFRVVRVGDPRRVLGAEEVVEAVEEHCEVLSLVRPFVGEVLDQHFEVTPLDVTQLLAKVEVVVTPEPGVGGAPPVLGEEDG
ncbi:hypothetical protein GS887_09945 [Rhodococcus hoagii]|nr:hypothetical protein [Prescottella equi]NKV71104.1 hypothetical protein [Prescottella equi]